MNFTGQHRTFVEDVAHNNVNDYVGLIVCANSDNQSKYIKMEGGVVKGNKAITINESLPILNLCKKDKDKSCFGVISDSEDESRREFGAGAMIGILEKEEGDTRLFINSLGEGGIWVSNKNGILESGDYITTSSIPGYGEKQVIEFMANYTVGKITMGCDFNPQKQKVYKIAKEMRDVKYYYHIVKKTELDKDPASGDYKTDDPRLIDYTYDEEKEEYYSEFSEEDYLRIPDVSSNDWRTLSRRLYKEMTKNEERNKLDEKNELVWEETDEDEMAYNLRYLLEDGTIISKELYDEKLANNEKVYIAAFVGCTYHCG